MKHEHKLSRDLQKDQQQTASHQEKNAQASGLCFDSPEEALRHDAHNTDVPPGIEERLLRSVGNLPEPEAQPWWKRIFNR